MGTRVFLLQPLTQAGPVYLNLRGGAVFSLQGFQAQPCIRWSWVRVSFLPSFNGGSVESLTWFLGSPLVEDGFGLQPGGERGGFHRPF